MKTKKIDYIKAVDDSLWHDPEEDFRPKTKKVLRELVRKAVRAALLGAYTTQRSQDVTKDANRIARETCTMTPMQTVKNHIALIQSDIVDSEIHLRDVELAVDFEGEPQYELDRLEQKLKHALSILESLKTKIKAVL